jgi:hypothetical protein
MWRACARGCNRRTETGHREPGGLLDVAESVALAATNPNLTGTVIESDGGARLVSLA